MPIFLIKNNKQWGKGRVYINKIRSNTLHNQSNRDIPRYGHRSMFFNKQGITARP